MAPGSLLIMSGAAILIAVSAYDFVAGSAALNGIRRRKHATCVDASPGSLLAARLSRYGLHMSEPRTQLDDQTPPIIPGQTSARFAEVVDDLAAFHAWLMEDRGVTSAPSPGQRVAQDRHLPPAGALSRPKSAQDEASAPETASLGLLGRLSDLDLAEDLRRRSDAARVR